MLITQHLDIVRNNSHKLVEMEAAALRNRILLVKGLRALQSRRFRV